MTPAPASIPALLRSCRTVAVVGLSPREDRPSHEVAHYLQTQGYRIVPVNPACAGNDILGEHCYATLAQAARALGETGARIELVDCFRRPEHMMDIVEAAIAIGAEAVWMQLGVVNEAAAQRAREAGLAVVMDHCMKIEHMRLAT